MSDVTLPVVGTTSRRKLGIVATLAFMLAAPLILPSYFTGRLLHVVILAIFVLGFNQLFGYTGLLSFGHAAYYGTGAYVTSIVLSNDAVPSMLQSMLPAIVIAVMAALVVAAIFGGLCVQRGEIYFAILTLAFSMMLYRLAIQWDSVTGGVNGLIISDPQVDFVVFSFSALDTIPYYYFSLAFAIAVVAVLWRLINSPYGELLMAVRENPERAEFIGMPVKRYQWTSFVISGGVAGLAGALAAIRTFVITPDSVHWLKSSEPVLITILGGPGTFVGPLLGTIVFVGLEELLSSITTYWQFGLGLVLIPVVLYAQDGLMGLIRNRNWPAPLGAEPAADDSAGDDQNREAGDR